MQQAREAARRSTCKNNLKQLALALHNFHDNRNRFPIANNGGSGTWKEQPEGNLQPNWHVVILPYIDQTAMYNVTQTQPHPAGANDPSLALINKPGYMRCPSDPFEGGSPFWTNYAASNGPQQMPQFCSGAPSPFSQYATPDVSFPGDPTWGYTSSQAFGGWGVIDNPLPSNRGIIIWSGSGIGPKEAVRMRDITDGTSNTLMVGEYEPKYEERMPAGSSGGSSTTGTPIYGGWAGHWTGNFQAASTIIPINWPIDDNANCGWNTWGQPANQGDPLHAHDNFSVSWGFRSLHTGGAQFGLADGSVRFLSQSIDHKLYQHLGCRNDNQVLSEF